MNDETTVAGELEKAGGEALTQTETAVRRNRKDRKHTAVRNDRSGKTDEKEKLSHARLFAVGQEYGLCIHDIHPACAVFYMGSYRAFVLQRR